MRFFTTVFVLSIFMSNFAFTQSDSSASKTTEVSISGGTAIPSLPYPFKEFWKSGINIGFGYGYSMNPGSLGYGSLFGTVGYNRFPFDREGYVNALNVNPATTGIEGDATSIITLMGTLKGTFSTNKQSVAPYFLFSLGYMNVTSGQIRWKGAIARPKETKAGFAYELGAGLDVPANERVTIFAEGKFFLGFTSEPGRQYFPICIGARIKP